MWRGFKVAFFFFGKVEGGTKLNFRVFVGYENSTYHQPLQFQQAMLRWYGVERGKKKICACMRVYFKILCIDTTTAYHIMLHGSCVCEVDTLLILITRKTRGNAFSPEEKTERLSIPKCIALTEWILGVLHYLQYINNDFLKCTAK